MFLTYEEYKEYGGGLDEAAFKIYGYEAEKKVDAETHGRYIDATEQISVKRCIARLADIISKSDITNDKVTSWNNDGVSKSIKDVSAEEYGKKINDVIFDYLSTNYDINGVSLLSLGVD